MNRITCRLLPALMVLMVAACTRTAPPAPYPHESILSIIAELKLGLDRDPYREPPWQDLQGLNIFKVTLDRLDALEGLAAGEYRDVLDFARGQALERLGQWSEAAAAFDRAAAAGTELAEPATVRAAAARRLAELADRSRLDVSTIESYLNGLEATERRLLDWASGAQPEEYQSFAMQEAELAREERAALLLDHRRVLSDGDQRALAAAEALVETFADSWRLNEHLLALGGVYETFAREYGRRYPPYRSQFDAEGVWGRWIAAARQAYRRVALADGDPAKLEGQARLQALDAYVLRVEGLGR